MNGYLSANRKGVAAHEFGHAMGLNDYNTNRYSIMCQMGSGRLVNVAQKTDLDAINIKEMSRMIKNKYIVLSISILLIMIISVGCANKTSNNSYKEGKKEIVIARMEGDYIKAYNNSKELFNDSDIVFKGIVTNTNTIEKDGTIRTLIDFQVKEKYKGDEPLKEIKISIMGGLMDGEAFIKSSIGKMFIEKGESAKDLESKYTGKNVRFAGFEGERIPIKGETYIVFAVNSDIDDNLYYILGGGYEQGLLAVIDSDKVEEYNPEKKRNDLELKILSIDELIKYSEK